LGVDLRLNSRVPAVNPQEAAMSEETASEQAGPDGPDFTKGVPAGDIAEGGMLAGRVGDEAVLIARAGGTLHAIGAECTHYHGPLAQGLIVGETVRCPWHHACFSLKTGKAEGAPAIDPVACWSVEERDGKVFVRAKKDAAKPAKTAGATARRVVIVGGGAAGFAAAERLRRDGFDGEVTLLSADPDAPYDRPNCSKDYLAGAAPEEWMPLRDEAFYRDARIDLRTATEVASFDPKARTVSIAGGGTVAYDILILATGAEPRRPPIPGLDGPNVYSLRTLKDAAALIAAARPGARAAVIGASFIGLEVAAALKQRGLGVQVIAPETTPLEKVLGRELGEWVRGVHEKKGVVFHLGRKVLGYADGHVTMDEGDPVGADFVVVGTGVKPRIVLARAAGLTVDNGVVTDDRLKTSADGVYAAGDIARYPDPVSGKLIRVEHWVHAERQGQYLARLILGDERPFSDPPFFWSSHYGEEIRYSGHAEGFDEPQVEGSVMGEDAIVRFRADGKLLAVATLGRDLENLKTEEGFERKT
jgi:NADPH-dependent 2,4-dienoyl-CoA reductase/sulfur reductase-like enzyme/nitrite reductase/ring-hydroxylating ferredoxin subunit